MRTRWMITLMIGMMMTSMIRSVPNESNERVGVEGGLIGSTISSALGYRSDSQVRVSWTAVN